LATWRKSLPLSTVFLEVSKYASRRLQNAAIKPVLWLCFPRPGVSAVPMDRELAARCLAELGNLTRLDIYRLLVRAGPSGLNISDIQTRLDVPASTLAFHLRGLVGAGLVAQAKN